MRLSLLNNMSLQESGIDLDAGIAIFEGDAPFGIAMAVLASATSCIALLVDTILIYALCRDRNIPFDSQFIISLSLADALFSLVNVAIQPFDASRGGYAMGNVGCMLNAGLCIIFAACSIVSISMLAAYRYLVGIRNYHPSQKQVLIAIGSVWIVSACVVTSFLPIWKQVVALQSGNGYCFIAFWSRDPVAMTASLANV